MVNKRLQAREGDSAGYEGNGLRASGRHPLWPPGPAGETKRSERLIHCLQNSELATYLNPALNSLLRLSTTLLWDFLTVLSPTDWEQGGKGDEPLGRAVTLPRLIAAPWQVFQPLLPSSYQRKNTDCKHHFKSMPSDSRLSCNTSAWIVLIYGEAFYINVFIAYHRHWL